jgi:hypothetical protein
MMIMRSRTAKNINTPEKECQEYGEEVRRNVTALILSSLRPENLVCFDWKKNVYGGFEKRNSVEHDAVYPMW